MRRMLALLVLLISFSAVAQDAEIRTITHRAKALEGNLLGESADQEIAIYLPPGYAQSTARYPVLYLLHGIGGGFTDWTKHWDIRGAMEATLKSGAPPFVIVMPNGANRLGGGFYADSPTSGNWETYLVRELIPRIDAELRTIATPAGRGVAGHSMGGFGAIRLAMRHPDLFGSVYAMSPCCLDMTGDIGHGNPEWAKALRFTSMDDLGRAAQNREFWPVAMIALSTVVSPNANKPPFFVDFPVRAERGELLPNDAVYEQWRATLPLAQLPSHRASLMKLEAIALDYGTSDQFAHIMTATPEFSRELARLRIPHTLDVYAGDHRKQIQARLGTHVLPFFGRVFRE